MDKPENEKHRTRGIVATDCYEVNIAGYSTHGIDDSITLTNLRFATVTDSQAYSSEASDALQAKDISRILNMFDLKSDTPIAKFCDIIPDIASAAPDIEIGAKRLSNSSLWDWVNGTASAANIVQSIYALHSSGVLPQIVNFFGSMK